MAVEILKNTCQMKKFTDFKNHPVYDLHNSFNKAGDKLYISKTLLEPNQFMRWRNLFISAVVCALLPNQLLNLSMTSLETW